MPGVLKALRSGEIDNLPLMGCNTLSSFADANAVSDGLACTRLVVSYELFLNDTARRFADVVLPSTAWLEELGCKATHIHLYLMEPALAPAGETHSLFSLVQALAQPLNLDGFYPWSSDEAVADAVLNHPSTGQATVAALRAEGGMRAVNVSHVGNPTLDFDTPSRKINFTRQKRMRWVCLPCRRWTKRHPQRQQPPSHFLWR